MTKIMISKNFNNNNNSNNNKNNKSKNKKYYKNKNNKHYKKNKDYFKRQLRPYDVSDMPEKYKQFVQLDNAYNFKLPEFKPQDAKTFLTVQTPKYLKIQINKILNKLKRNLYLKNIEADIINSNIENFVDELAAVIVPIIKNEETIKVPSYQLLSSIDNVVCKLYDNLTKYIPDQLMRKNLISVISNFNCEIKMHCLFAIEVAQMKVEKEQEIEINDILNN